LRLPTAAITRATGLILITGALACDPPWYYVQRVEVRGTISEVGSCQATFAKPSAPQVTLPGSAWHRDSDTVRILCSPEHGGPNFTTLYFDLPIKATRLATPMCFRFGDHRDTRGGLSCGARGYAEVSVLLQRYAVTDGTLILTSLGPDTHRRPFTDPLPLEANARFELRGHRTGFWCIDC
jgi:hypothetical protein